MKKQVIKVIYFYLFLFLLFMSYGSDPVLASKGVVLGEMSSRKQLPPKIFIDPHDSEYVDNGSEEIVSWDMPITEEMLRSLGLLENSDSNKQTIYTTQIISKPASILQGSIPLIFTGTSTNNRQTRIEIINPTQDRTITIPDSSGEITLLGQSISGLEIVDNTIELASKTTGNFVQNITSGNGINLSGTEDEAWTPTISLGNLTGNWTQSAAYDIVLNNQDSEFKMLSSDGSHYAVFDVGNLSSDVTYTLTGNAGTFLTSSNYSSYITGLTGFLLTSNNLSDVGNAATTRTNLGLGTIATEAIGNFLQTSNNFSDLTNTSTAKINLGLGSIATQAASSFFQATNNFSEVTNAISARTNLGLGSIATQATSSFLQTINNLSEFANSSGARTNLGLGSIATQSASSVIISGGNLDGVIIGNSASSSGGFTTLSSSGTTLLSTNGDVTIGNASGLVQIVSSGLDVSSTGLLSGITGYTQDSGNMTISGTGSLSTGTGGISLNGNTTVASSKTLAVTSADSLTVGGNIIPQTVTLAIPMVASLVDQNIFVADANYQISAVRCVYSVAASLNGTLQVTVETGTSAPGTGTSQLSSTINLSSSTNTVYTGTLIGSPTTISAGNKVSFDVGGTLLGLLGTCTVTLKRV